MKTFTYILLIGFLSWAQTCYQISAYLQEWSRWRRVQNIWHWCHVGPDGTLNAALCGGLTEKREWASQMGQHGGPKTEWERQSEWIHRVPTNKSAVSGGRGALGSVSLILSLSLSVNLSMFFQFICIMDSKDMTLGNVMKYVPIVQNWHLIFYYWQETQPTLQ